MHSWVKAEGSAGVKALRGARRDLEGGCQHPSAPRTCPAAGARPVPRLRHWEPEERVSVLPQSQKCAQIAVKELCRLRCFGR